MLPILKRVNQNQYPLYKPTSVQLPYLFVYFNTLINYNSTFQNDSTDLLQSL
ncbi:Uncharacterised protein [Acinetobacter haemolyticus]|nr:Uncharacterised protein [Acinetobacter haemolyticus]